MRFKKLILCYNAIFNKYTTNNSALFFKNSDDLIIHLNNIVNKKVNINNIAETLYLQTEKKYKWSLISNKYEILFHDCLKLLR